MNKTDEIEIQSLLKVIANEPNNGTAYNRLGILYYKQTDWQEAIHYYHLALKAQPQHLNTYYNLGLAYTKNEQIEKAISAYQTILDHDTHNTAACFQLGCLFLHLGQLTQAIHYFLRVEQQETNHFETQSNLGTCYLKQGELELAKLHYQKAYALQTNDLQILFNLGVISMQLGAIDEAIRYYQLALRTHPTDFSTHNNCGVAFLARQNIPLALLHFKEALHLQPHNTALAYTVHSLNQGPKLASAPPEYIKNLFDSYAYHYDEHLQTHLAYQIPNLLLKAVSQTHMHEIPLSDILDLGCGTGLCGALFKPYAKTLIGVDLSKNMLQIAADKHIYDELITQDLLSALQDSQTVYDLILAGDVLVYTGDLDPIFSAVRQHLRPQGLFVFNTEIAQIEAFEMQPTGRFSHHASYLTQLAEKHGLDCVSYEKILGRMQNNNPVHGHLYVLQATLKANL